MFLNNHTYLRERTIQISMKSISNNSSFNLVCPRCFSNNLYRFGKDKDGFQKFQCKCCKRQWAPESSAKPRSNYNKYPPCPRCGKATFLHHDYQLYSYFTCSDKRCNHHFSVPKLVEIPNTSSSHIDLEKFTIKRMRHPFHIVFTALTLYFFDNSTLRKISQHLELVCEVKVSHVTVSNWCKRFAPALLNAASPYKKQLSLSESDEWHFDETYIKINGKDYYVWFALDFETRVILDFHISEYRDSTAAHILLNSCNEQFGKPRDAVVMDRYYAYREPVKRFFPNTDFIQVESFDDIINNNPIEAFNGQFKAWYKPKRGFKSFDSANLLISLFVFFYNFVRPHSSLNNLAPAQVAGAKYSDKARQKFLLIT